MPLIDCHCYFGANGEALSVRPLDPSEASAYADSVDAELMLFASEEATTDLDGGNGRLAAILGTDKRFRGWLTLSVHHPDTAQNLARKYLVKPVWIGARFDQRTDEDAIDAAGGYIILNALRRYGRPVLLTVNSPATLHAAIAAAREFHTVKFIIAPQCENITADSIPAIREVINTWWLPSAAYAERDVVAQAVASLGERRVLWGSDWGRLHPAAALGMINESQLTGLQRERIVLRNPRELLTFDD